LDDNVCGCSDEDDCAWSDGTKENFCPNIPPTIPPVEEWSADNVLPTCQSSECECEPNCGDSNSKCADGYCCTGDEPEDPNPKCKPITTILDPWLCT
jgi:hypothetical protein